MVVNYEVPCQDGRVMEDVSVRFAKRLKHLRQRHHLTQERLAELAEVSDKHIQRLESNKPCGVRLVTLDRLARAFGVTLSDLLKL